MAARPRRWRSPSRTVRYARSHPSLRNPARTCGGGWLGGAGLGDGNPRSLRPRRLEAGGGRPGACHWERPASARAGFAPLRRTRRAGGRIPFAAHRGRMALPLAGRARILERSRRGRRHAALSGAVSAHVLRALRLPLHRPARGGRRRPDRSDRGRGARGAASVRLGGRRAGQPARGRPAAAGARAARPAPGSGHWDATTLCGMLRNPAYQGTAMFGRTRAVAARAGAAAPDPRAPPPAAQRRGLIHAGAASGMDRDPGARDRGPRAVRGGAGAARREPPAQARRAAPARLAAAGPRGLPALRLRVLRQDGARRGRRAPAGRLRLLSLHRHGRAQVRRPSAVRQPLGAQRQARAGRVAAGRSGAGRPAPGCGRARAARRGGAGRHGARGRGRTGPADRPPAARHGPADRRLRRGGDRRRRVQAAAWPG